MYNYSILFGNGKIYTVNTDSLLSAYCKGIVKYDSPIRCITNLTTNEVYNRITFHHY